jgi:hypothetical protein
MESTRGHIAIIGAGRHSSARALAQAMLSEPIVAVQNVLNSAVDNSISITNPYKPIDMDPFHKTFKLTSNHKHSYRTQTTKEKGNVEMVRWICECGRVL